MAHRAPRLRPWPPWRQRLTTAARRAGSHPHLHPEEEPRAAIAFGGDVVIERQCVFEKSLPAATGHAQTEAGGAGVLAGAFVERLAAAHAADVVETINRIALQAHVGQHAGIAQLELERFAGIAGQLAGVVAAAEA